MKAFRSRGINLSTVTFLVLILSILVLTMLTMTPSCQVEAWPAGRDKKMLACRFLKQNGFNLPPECNPKSDWH